MSKKQPRHINLYFSQESLNEELQNIFQQILKYVSQDLPRIEFVRNVLNILMDFSKCNGIELRLLKVDKCYQYSLIDFPKKEFKREVWKSVKIDNEGIIPCKRNHSGFEQICRRLFQNDIGHYLPYMTNSGCFWMGDIENFSSEQTKKNPEGETGCFDCFKKIRSIAIFPLSVRNEKIGALILKSKRKYFFSEDEIKSYENFCQNLALILIYQRAQPALRERIKELTCLYGITQTATRPDVSLSEFLKIVLEIIPPAWQYPEITHCRISLNGNIYKTSNFKEGLYKQRADIIIRGEKRGFIEIDYTKDSPELDEGPFLKEERNLIDAIAKELSMIIEHKQADEEKARLQKQLLHADRLATIGQLAAGIAHELNEPLGNILGFSQLINKDTNIPNNIKQDVEKIIRASLHSREIVRKLLIFSRQIPTKKEEVNLNRIVEDGIYFFESRCVKEGIDVVCKLYPGLPKIIADPAQLTQVFVNLVVNAIQSMPKGGKLTVQTIGSEDYVALIVEDTGVGMSEEVLKNIFHPFFTTKDVGQGTGLGLAVVHGIVTSHKGVIKVDSKIGGGSRFEIELPLYISEEED